MCDYCRIWHGDNTICGQSFEINAVNDNHERFTDAQILQNENDKEPGIVIFLNGRARGYFNITYCPRCGRKLVED